MKKNIVYMKTYCIIKRNVHILNDTIAFFFVFKIFIVFKEAAFSELVMACVLIFVCVSHVSFQKHLQVGIRYSSFFAINF